jgi:hypothetical protein
MFAIEHVFYVSQGDYAVRELYYNGNWWGNNLTADTNGPPAYANSVTSLIDDWNIERVFYVSQGDHHVRELYYSNGKWSPYDITAATGAPPVESPYALTSVVDKFNNYVCVFYVANNGYVWGLDSHDGKIWYPSNVTAAANGAPAYANSLTSFIDIWKIWHVFYVSQGDYNVRELYLNGGWHSGDLSNGRSPDANPGTLTSFFDSYNIEHVFYVGTDFHVWELYNNGSWQSNDLTNNTGGPNSYPYALTSFFENGFEHVFFISASSNDVYELYRNGNWVLSDLTTIASGPGAAPYGPASYFENGMEHVFYIDNSGQDVYELYRNTNGCCAWTSSNLTAQTGNIRPDVIDRLTGFAH